MSQDLTPAVVLGLSPTGLHVVRALGRVGVPVYGIGEGVQSGSASRYLSRHIEVSDKSKKLETLLTLFGDADVPADMRPVLIPTSDQDVDFVIENAEALSRAYSFQKSYSDGLAARIMTKDSFYALCAENGISYPRLWATTKPELAGLADRLTYPCMIKPSRIHDIKDAMKGRKGWTVRNAADVKQVAADIPEGAGALLVQQIVAGPESAITLFCVHVDAQGAMRQAFTARKLRQYPPGFGSASMAQSNSEPQTAEISIRFLQAIGYHGIAASEFKRDPVSGELFIIEINVRPSLWFSLSQASGKDVVLSAYRELAGITEPLAETGQRMGVRWRYLLKDVWSGIFYRTKSGFILPPPDLNAAGKPLGTTWAVFSSDDPKPAIVEVGNFLRKGMKRLFGSSS